MNKIGMVQYDLMLFSPFSPFSCKCIEGPDDFEDTQLFSLSLWGEVLIKSDNNKREQFSFPFLRLVCETNLCSCSSGGEQRACPKGPIPVLQNAGLKSCVEFATASSLPQWTGVFMKIGGRIKDEISWKV